MRVQNHFNHGIFDGPFLVSPADALGRDAIDLSDGEWAERVEFHVDEKTAGVRPPPPGDDVSTPRLSPQTPSTLFNSMIAPLTPLAIRGAIWYQGCSNHIYPEPYADLQDLLVKSWREAFRNPSLVFIGTQLAGFREHRPENPLPDDWWRPLSPVESRSACSFAYIREAQERLLDEPRCGLACAIDLGDHSDIHPARKKPVGERLALEAMRVAYGDTTAASPPRATGASLVVEPQRPEMPVSVAVAVTTDTDSLTPFSIPASAHLFALVDNDGSCAWADATVLPDGSLRVVSPKILHPVRVEYAFSDYPPEAALLHRSADGLPLLPFRHSVDQGL